LGHRQGSIWADAPVAVASSSAVAARSLFGAVRLSLLAVLVMTYLASGDGASRCLSM
jgi:hypothetical protein